MDSNSTWLCRLCLQQSDDVVNIFDSFQNTTIASILLQHFWFQGSKDDGISECICQICWINTKTFHIFYEAVELRQKDYWNSVKSAETNFSSDLTKQDRSCSSSDTGLQVDLNFVKCEEIELQGVETELKVDLNIVKCGETELIAPLEIFDEESFDLSDGAACEQSETGPTLSNDKEKDQPPKAKRKKNCVKKEKMPESETKSTKYNNDYLDSQLRVYFSMKCHICGESFETYRSAKKHYRLVHKMNGHLTCCGRKFYKRYKLLSHIDYHLNPNPFSCEQCGRRFANKSSLDAHIEHHEPFSSRAFKCDLCPERFIRERELLKHKEFVHCPVKCPECDMSFPSRSKLTTHTKNAHQSKVTTRLVCDICGKDFVNKYTLLYHMQWMHSTSGNLKFQCDVCGAWSKNRTLLLKHLYRHRGAAKCSICNKVLQNKYSLASHIQYAHVEKRYQCIICDKKFRKSLTLKEHMAGHNNQDLYQCAYCTKTFKSSANLHSHRKKMHPAEWTRDRRDRNTMPTKTATLSSQVKCINK